MGDCLLILQGTDDPQPAGPAHLMVSARDGQSGGVANGPSFRSRDAEPDHVTSIVRDPSDARGRASPARIPGPRPIPGGILAADRPSLRQFGWGGEATSVQKQDQRKSFIPRRSFTSNSADELLWTRRPVDG